jgi:hypothetical protein
MGVSTVAVHSLRYKNKQLLYNKKVKPGNSLANYMYEF